MKLEMANKPHKLYSIIWGFPAMKNLSSFFKAGMTVLTYMETKWETKILNWSSCETDFKLKSFQNIIKANLKI